MSRLPSRRLLASSIAVLAGLAALFLAPSASAQTTRALGSSVTVAGTGEDVWASGATVAVTGTVADLHAAGATVTVAASQVRTLRAAGARVAIDSAVWRDIWAVGGTVSAEGSAGNNVWLAGADVAAGLTVHGDLKIAGGSVVISSDTAVDGALRAAGGDIAFEGSVRGETTLVGGLVTFNGTAEGKVTVTADRLVIGPQARIAGELVLVGRPELETDPAASLAGEPRYEEKRYWWQDVQAAAPFEQFKMGLVGAAVAFAAGIFLLVIARGALEEGADRVRGEFLTSFCVGIAGLILVPLFVIVAAVTVIGIPVAIVVLLTIPFIVLGSYVAAALGIADFLANRSGAPRTVLHSVLYLFGGAVVLALVCFIPYAGPFIVLLVLLAGFGAMLRTVLRRLCALLPATA